MNLTIKNLNTIRDNEENEKIYGYTESVLNFYKLEKLYDNKTKRLRGYKFEENKKHIKLLTTHQRVREFMSSVDGCKFLNKELKRISNKNLINETI